MHLTLHLTVFKQGQPARLMPTTGLAHFRAAPDLHFKGSTSMQHCIFCQSRVSRREGPVHWAAYMQASCTSCTKLEMLFPPRICCNKWHWAGTQLPPCSCSPRQSLICKKAFHFPACLQTMAAKHEPCTWQVYLTLFRQSFILHRKRRSDSRPIQQPQVSCRHGEEGALGRQCMFCLSLLSRGLLGPAYMLFSSSNILIHKIRG